MSDKIGVLRHINYGHVFSGTEFDGDKVIDKFFSSFLELSNGRVINIMTICQLDTDGSFGDCDLQILPTLCYLFGENYDEYWEKTFTYDELERSQEDLTNEEYMVAKDFYLSSIFSTREISTEVVYCYEK